MFLFPPSFSGNEANQSFQDSWVTKIAFLLLYLKEEGRAGWQLEGIVRGSVELSEQNSTLSEGGGEGRMANGREQNQLIRSWGKKSMALNGRSLDMVKSTLIHGQLLLLV
jgi:hypothetical protein